MSSPRAAAGRPFYIMMYVTTWPVTPEVRSVFNWPCFIRHLFVSTGKLEYHQVMCESLIGTQAKRMDTPIC